MDELFPPILMRDMDFAMPTSMKRMDDQMNSFMMIKSSPGYKIDKDETKVELIIEVPGFKKEDINLDV